MAQEMIGETGKRSARQTAILYFSVSGTTERAAQAIHRCIPGSTLICLEPQQPYVTTSLRPSAVTSSASKIFIRP